MFQIDKCKLFFSSSSITPNLIGEEQITIVLGEQMEVELKGLGYTIGIANIVHLPRSSLLRRLYRDGSFQVFP